MIVVHDYICIFAENASSEEDVIDSKATLLAKITGRDGCLGGLFA